jgi:hypothetical protein
MIVLMVVCERVRRQHTAHTGGLRPHALAGMWYVTSTLVAKDWRLRAPRAHAHAAVPAARSARAVRARGLAGRAAEVVLSA